MFANMFNAVRAKLTAYLVVFLIVTGGLLFLALDRFVQAEFERIERDEARMAISRALEAIRNDGKSLYAWARDIGPWDETYEFVETADPEYISNNFPPESIEIFELDLLLFSDSADTLVWSHISDEMSIEDLRYKELPGFAGRTPGWDSSSGHVGLHRTDANTVYIIAVHPIQTSEYGGPSRGATVFGRELDNDRFEKLIESSVAGFELQNFPAGSQPASTAIEVLRANGETSAQTVLRDFNDVPVLSLKVRAHKDTTTNGAHATYFVMYAYAVVALLGFVFFQLLLLQLSRKDRET